MHPIHLAKQAALLEEPPGDRFDLDMGNQHRVGTELPIHVMRPGVFVYQPAEQIATSEMKVGVVKVGVAMSQVTAVDELFGTHNLPHAPATTKRTPSCA